ncbi:LexA family transcriptional regulator [Pseudomonas helleri]|uniref:Helix-turn-helix domain-containing protein n=1 Tax=Pseudomonas helleri TaxID=1608996 RepID=A0A6I1WWM4_9PSED|nr:LexA family transcriptional regulator [Pseudomonas helleri]MQU43095.1 helix-turn-helix domain-containing protein [Pseudomonas helleri]
MSKKPLPPEKKEECLRLKALFNARKNELGLTQEKLAHALEMNQSSVSHYLNGINPLNASVAAAFARILGVEVSEFSERLAGEILKISKAVGPQSVMEGNVITVDFSRKPDSDGYVTIPRLDVSASMGRGISPPEGYIDVIRDITVHLDWLARRGVHYSKLENLAIITGDGDSMEGTFSDGASLLIDRGITEIKTDAIYVFTLDGDLFIKRLQRITGKSLSMISDNPIYRPIDLHGEQLERMHVHARVLLAWDVKKL